MPLPRPLLVIALVLPTAGALTYFVAADPNDPGFRLTYSLSKTVQFGLPIVAMLAFDRRRWKAIRCTVRGTLVGSVLGLATLLVILATYALALRASPLLNGLAPQVRTKVAGFGFDSPENFVAFAIVLSLLHSFLEEYYWRWFVHAALGERLPQVPATVISSLAFAAHHVVVLHVYFPDHFWSATLPFSLAVAVGGAMWAWLYDRYGSLAGPWAAHALADLALMAVGFDLLYR
jgi:membrane protease YdiL (CAAX protease family)